MYNKDDEILAIREDLNRTLMEQYHVRTGLFKRYDQIKFTVDSTSSYVYELHIQLIELKKEIHMLKTELSYGRQLEKVS
jgi:hypothetical protein